MEAAFLIVLIIIVIISSIETVQRNKLKKKLEKYEGQSDKDNARIEQMEKTVSQLQMRIDMLSQSRQRRGES